MDTATGRAGCGVGLAALARRLEALPPSLGPVRLVAVDGHAGSGKTTFARALGAALGGAPVLHTDDLASHDALFDWTERLRALVLEPLSRGAVARYAPYDWVARRFGGPAREDPAGEAAGDTNGDTAGDAGAGAGAGAGSAATPGSTTTAGAGERLLAPAPVVLVEGVGSGRRALRPYLAHLLWMDVADREAWRRGRRRDGPELAGFWARWRAAERRHFTADPSRRYADALVVQRALRPEGPEGLKGTQGPEGPESPAGPEGRAQAYEIRPGPRNSARDPSGSGGTSTEDHST